MSEFTPPAGTVTMFTTTWCGYCRRLKSQMQREGIGFTARAVTTGLTHDPAEMAEVRWVSREEYAALLRSGTIRVPGAISIARRLIERWLGQDVESAAGGPVVEGWRPGVS